MIRRAAVASVAEEPDRLRSDESAWHGWFTSDPMSVPMVRRLVRTVLIERRCTDEQVECGEMIVSELATNSFKISRPVGRPFAVEVSVTDAGTACVAVWDSADAKPEVQPEDCASESGRGLAIVAALAHRWGVERTEPGKWTWAEL